MPSIEKMKAKLERLQHEQEVLKAREDRQMARLNTAKRKQQTKRLIEKGRILEDIQAQAEGLTKAPKVSRVDKTDDPQGYAKYQAYKAYSQDKEQLSEQISPADSEQWLEQLVIKATILEKIRQLFKTAPHKMYN